MKKINIFLLALSVVLVLAASIGSAFALISTYADARGGYVVELGDTDIKEEFSDWTKRVVVTSTEDNQPVYVRARAFAGNQYELRYSGDGWTVGEDGYFYYDEILYGGESTTELRVQINNIPEDIVPGDSFDVFVIYETTPVQHREDGTPYSDWNLRVSSGGDEG